MLMHVLKAPKSIGIEGHRASATTTIIIIAADAIDAASDNGRCRSAPHGLVCCGRPLVTPHTIPLPADETSPRSTTTAAHRSQARGRSRRSSRRSCCWS